MNFAHLTSTVTAGAVLAAAMLVGLGADDGADPAASIRARASAHGPVEREDHVEGVAGIDGGWRAGPFDLARVVHASTTPAGR